MTWILHAKDAKGKHANIQMRFTPNQDLFPGGPHINRFAQLITDFVLVVFCNLFPTKVALEEIHIVFTITIKEDPQVLMNLIFTLVAIDHFASPCGLVCGALVSLLIAFLPSSTDGLPLLRPISLFGGLCPISFA